MARILSINEISNIEIGYLDSDSAFGRGCALHVCEPHYHFAKNGERMKCWSEKMQDDDGYIFRKMQDEDAILSLSLRRCNKQLELRYNLVKISVM